MKDGFPEDREFAIVIRSLELRAQEQRSNIENLRDDVSKESAAWQNMANQLTGDGDSLPRVHSVLPVFPIGQKSWGELVEESASHLEHRGLDPRQVSLPLSVHHLDVTDVLSAVAIGGIGAAVPSIKIAGTSLSDVFQTIQSHADSGQLPGFLQAVLGRHSEGIMDSAGGALHRFVEGHDLLAILPAMAEGHGVVSGIARTFQHLATDAFGRTGIPMPGTNLFGDRIVSFLGGDTVADIAGPASLSHYAALRMTDAASMGVTSLLLYGYNKVRAVPDGSLRKQKMAILAHGFCMTAVMLAAATVPGMAMRLRWRSYINYVSLVAMLKNVWQLHRGIRLLDAQNEKTHADLDAVLSALWCSRFGSLADGEDVWRELDTSAARMASLREE